MDFERVGRDPRRALDFPQAFWQREGQEATRLPKARGDDANEHVLEVRLVKLGTSATYGSPPTGALHLAEVIQLAMGERPGATLSRPSAPTKVRCSLVHCDRVRSCDA